jgi:hypothetical protein
VSPPGRRDVYIDESKRSGYVLAAVTVTDPPAVRRMVQGLVLPDQRRLHMKREQTRRRGTIVSALVEAPIQATIYDASRSYSPDREARAVCLAALVRDLSGLPGPTRLVIEQDDSLVSFDNQRLIELTRSLGKPAALRYEHRRAFEEPLLALPDVVAWCWARSGEWRRRIAPLLTAVRQL